MLTRVIQIDGVGLFVDASADLRSGNLIEGNIEAGVLCIDSSLVIAAVQDFGSGNPGGNTIIAGDCRVQNGAGDPEFP